MADPFIQRTPPKSTGREYYSEAYILNHFPVTGTISDAQKADLLATACEWTAASITDNIEQFWQPIDKVDRVIVSGGGTRNTSLMERLASHMPNVDILTCEDFNIPIDAKEAVGFALFAGAFLREIPANLPRVTGAQRAVIMGRLTT
ncbi:MAG: anhydro-N-acetylmuramic acid kinase [Calditrichota bacterium]